MTTVINPRTGKPAFVYSPCEIEEFRLKRLTEEQLKNGERFSQSPGNIYDPQSSRSGNKQHKNKSRI